MSRINQEVIKAVIEARKVFGRQPERVACFIFEKDGFGTNERRIQYTVIKDQPNFGTGLSLYDGCVYVATFDDRALDLLAVGLAASSAPPKSNDALNTPATQGN